MMIKTLFLIFFIFNSLIINAQIQVVANKTSATYYGNEPVQFTVSGTSGTVEYKFGYAGDDTGITAISFIDESPNSVFESGTISIPAGGNYTFTPNFNATSLKAGSYICEVSQNGQKSLAIAFYNPLDIQPFETEPSDFESFWNSTKFALRL